MAPEAGWRPLSGPPRASRLRPLHFGDSPFARLALTHVLGIAGDTLVTMALAGSLFFSISPNAARGRVALYLLLTMAPFAVVAPLIGPLLDRSRGGRRLMVIASSTGRAVSCALMVTNLGGLLLFPLAFVVLVLSKAYSVTKSALVPTTVAGHGHLVEANARLAVLSGLAGFVAALPGIAVLKVLGPEWVVGLAAVVFGAAAVAGFKLVRPPEAESPIRPEAEKAELHAATIRLSATAMAVMRGMVGFFVFLSAFALRREGAPSWWFGVILAASVVGSLVGAATAPRLRRVLTEERMLAGSLLLVVGFGFLSTGLGSRGGLALLGGVLGVAAAAGKLAFDSIVQRDAPDAVRGRTFARFETRFQLVWVGGAAIPVVLSISLDLGMAVTTVAAAVAFAVYVSGLVAARHRGHGRPSLPESTAVPEETP